MPNASSAMLRPRCGSAANSSRNCTLRICWAWAASCFQADRLVRDGAAAGMAILLYPARGLMLERLGRVDNRVFLGVGRMVVRRLRFVHDRRPVASAIRFRSPQPKAAEEGVFILAGPAAWRQLGQLADIAASQHDVVGLERTLQLFHDLGHA